MRRLWKYCNPIICLVLLIGAVSSLSLAYFYAKYTYTYSHIIGDDLNVTVNGHSMEATEHNPTCYEDGYTVYTCTVDGCTYTYTVTDKGSSGHVWGEWTAAENYTYENQVKYFVIYRKCSRCDKIELTEYVSAEEMEKVLADLNKEAVVEHVYVVAQEVPATCTEDGYKRYHCNCTDGEAAEIGGKHAFTEVIEALGHDYRAEVIEPTCTTAGYTGHTCTRCADFYQTDPTPALDHDLTVVDEYVAPTCTQSGHTAAELCTRCQLLIHEAETIAALGHDYAGVTDWHQITDAANAAYVHEGTCSRCSTTLQQAHAYVELHRVDATCLSDGYSIKVCACVDSEGKAVRLYQHTEGDQTGYILHDAEGAPLRDEQGNICWYAGVAVLDKDGQVLVDENGQPVIVQISAADGYCGYLKIDILSALGHSAGDGEITTVTPATCTETGTIRYTCVHCHETVTESTEALGHAWEIVDSQDPNCTEDGWIKYTCTRCNAEKTEAQAAIGHIWYVTEDTATCQHGGEQSLQCVLCDATMTVASEIKGHHWEVQTEAVEPTCMNEGRTAIYACAYEGCDAIQGGDTIPMSGHTPKIHTVSATCCTQGYSIEICAVCGMTLGEKYNTMEPSPALHKYQTVMNSATCTQAGEETLKCSYCGDIQKLAVNALGHSMKGETVLQKATCTEAGEMYRYCTRPGCTYVDPTVVVIPALGHKWDEGVVTEPASCTENGKTLYTCTVCGESEEQVEKAWGHDYTEEPATCYSLGYRVCKVCKHSEIIPLQAHSYGDWKIASYATGCKHACDQGICQEGWKVRECKWCHITDSQTYYLDCKYDVVDRVEAVDCQHPGYVLEQCRYCGHQKTTALQGAHDYGEYELLSAATCGKGSVWVRICSLCGHRDQKQYSDATGNHTWSEDHKVIQVPDCENGVSGVAQYTCTVCGKTKTEEIAVDPNGHQWTVDQTVPATCLEAEHIHSVCSVCGKEKTEDVGEALGHDWVETERVEPKFPESDDPNAVGTDGYILYQCSRCDATDRIVLPWSHVHSPDYREGTYDACVYGIHCTDPQCGSTLQLPGHEYTVTQTDATCTREGYTTYTCEKCQHFYHTVTADKLPHPYVLIGGKQPTFDADGNLTVTGVLVYRCSACNAYQLVDISEYSELLHMVLIELASTQHEYYVYAGKTPTCTEDGAYHIFCMYHGVSVAYQESTDTFTETYVLQTEGNMQETFTVTVDLASAELDFTSLHKYGIYTLDDVKDRYGVLPMLNGHYAEHEGYPSAGEAAQVAGTAEWRITVPATCTATGKRELVCTVCGHIYETQIVAAGHDAPEHRDYIAPTCTKYGQVEHWQCPYCGDYLLQDEDGSYYTVDSVRILPNGHQYTRTETVHPTCTANGYSVYTCTVCGDSYHSDSIPATGHNNAYAWTWSQDCTSAKVTVTCSVCDLQKTYDAKVTSTVTKAPTCTETGLRDYTASVIVVSTAVTDTKTDVVIPATGHSYTASWSWAEDHSSATLTRVCTVCGHTETVTVTLGDGIIAVQQSVSCTQDGSTTYTATAVVEGVTYTDTATVIHEKATGHQFGAPKWSWSTDGSSATASFECTNGCGHTQTLQAADITSQVILAPTYSTDGTEMFTAKVDFNGEEHTDTYAVTLPRLGHSYEGTWTWNADYTGATLTLSSDTDPALNGKTHLVRSDGKITAATCDQDGKTVYMVTYTVTDPNGETHTFTDTKEVAIPALDHDWTDAEPAWSWNIADRTATATFTCVRKGCTHSETVTEAITHTNTVAPTCTAGGAEHYSVTVSFNGQTYTATETDPIPALGHDEVKTWIWAEDLSSAQLLLSCNRGGCQYSELAEADIAVTTTATCTEDGITTYTATAEVNGVSYTDAREVATAALGHVYEGKWTWDGYTSATFTLVCTRAGCEHTVSVEDVTVTGDPDRTNTAPTCTKDGANYYMATARYDGVTYTDRVTQVLPHTGHDYTDVTPSWIWTLKDGTPYYATAKFVCKTCGTETSVRSATYPPSEVTTAATCTTAGVRTYTATVTFNGKIYTTTTTRSISALGHSYSSAWTWAADHSSATVTLTCTRSGCGHTRSETDSAIDYTNSATCESAGKGTYTASVTIDGKPYSSTKTVTTPALGHAYDLDNATWIWAEDYSTATLRITCTRNGAHQLEIPAAVAGDPHKINVAPTCTTPGANYYVATAEYDGQTYTSSKTQTLAALGHAYNEPTAADWIWNADHTTATLKLGCTRDGCAHIVQLTATAADQTITSTTTATCTQVGVTTYTATVVDENGKQYRDVQTVATTALKHTYQAESWTWAGDHTSATLTLTCSKCLDQQTVSTSQITSQVTTEATCTTEGEITYTATAVYDGETYTGTKTGKVDALDHSYGAPTWTWDGVSSATATFTCERDSDHTQQEDATVTSRVVTEANCTTVGQKTYTATVTFNSQTYTTTKDVSTSTKCTYYVGEHTWSGTEGITLYDWSTDHTSVSYTASCFECTCCGSSCGCSTKMGTTTSILAVEAAYNGNGLAGENFDTSDEAVKTGTLYWAVVTIDGYEHWVLEYIPYGSDDGYYTDGLFRYHWNDATQSYILCGFSANAEQRTIAPIPAYVRYNAQTGRIEAVEDETAERYPVTSIAAEAFAGETSLALLYIPSTVTYIGSNAFSECSALNRLVVDDLVSWNDVTMAVDTNAGIPGVPSHPFLYYIMNANTSAEGYDGTHLYTLDGELTEVIDADLTGITDLNYALALCTNLQSVYIPSTLKHISDGAFAFDTSLCRIYVDDMVSWNDVVIENDSFLALMLMELTLEAGISLPDLPSHPFSWYLFGNLLANGNMSEMPRLYIRTPEAEPVEGNDTVVALHDTVFSEVIHADLSGIKELNLALFMCVNVQSIKVPACLTTIHDMAFFLNAQLGTLYLEDVDAWANVDIAIDSFATLLLQLQGGIEQDVLAHPFFWYFMTSMDSGDSAVPPPTVSVWNEVTGEYEAVTQITINAETIKPWVFALCTSIDTVTIGENVKYIGAYAFAGCFGNLDGTDPNKGIILQHSQWGAAESMEDALAGKLIDVFDATGVPPYAIAQRYEQGAYTYYLFKIEMAADENGYQFMEHDGKIYLIGHNGTLSGDVTLPTDYNGKPYAIYSSAFYGNTAITSVVIPDGVTAIGDHAFAGCTSLTSVTIGKNVTHISDGAFASCWSLNNLYVDSLAAWNRVTFETDSAFATEANANFPSHPFLWYAADNMESENLSTHLYVKDSTAEFGYREVIHADLTGITRLNYALALCTNLESVYIPSTLTYIADGAFAFDVKLNNLYVDDLVSWNNVTMESDTALAALMQMYGMTNMADMESPSHPFMWYVFVNYMFGDRAAIDTHLYIREADGAVSMFDMAFSEVIDADLTGITDLKYALALCTNLRSVYMPATLTHITDGAFTFDVGLSTMYLENVDAWAAVEIDMDTFAGVFSGDELPSHPFTWYLMMCQLQGVVGETNVYLAGDRANQLTAIEFSDAATVINDYTFFGCTNIDRVAVGKNVRYIGANAFTGCFVKLTLESEAEKGISFADPNGTWYYAQTREEALAGNGWVTDWTGLDGSLSLALAYRQGFSGINRIYLFKVEAVAEEESPYTFISYNGKYYLTGYTGSDSDITLPEYYNGQPYAIYSNAFRGNTTLTSVVIPAGVTAIGDYAFYGCTNLQSITVGEDVTYIGQYAFYGCTKLSSGGGIILADTADDHVWFYSQQKTDALQNGTLIDVHSYTPAALAQAYLDSSNRIYQYCLCKAEVIAVDDYVFVRYGEEYSLVGYTGMASQLVLPSIGSPYGIYQEAFAGNTAITSVVIPEGVTSIGMAAFMECTSLKSVTLPRSLTVMGEGAFAFCVSLERIDIPVGVTEIPAGAFVYCIMLKEVTLPDGITSIGDTAFGLCAKMSSISLPNSLREIGTGAFASCASLRSIVIPNGVTVIAAETFVNCTALRSVTLPRNLTSIGDRAFEYCESLESITIPAGVTSIGQYAFNGCSALTSVTMPYSMQTIGDYAFQNCTALTSVVFNDPNGWYCASSGTATSGTVLTLTDSATNATYLRSTYSSYYWKKG